jgi:hypothetical protein
MGKVLGTAKGDKLLRLTPKCQEEGLNCLQRESICDEELLRICNEDLQIIERAESLFSAL